MPHYSTPEPNDAASCSTFTARIDSLCIGLDMLPFLLETRTRWLQSKSARKAPIRSPGLDSWNTLFRKNVAQANELRRILQGLSTVEDISTGHIPPYFQGPEHVSEHITLHLSCSLDTVSWQPTFHTLFYWISSRDSASFGRWAHGPLYGDNNNLILGKCTYTVLAESTENVRSVEEPYTFSKH